MKRATLLAITFSLIVIVFPTHAFAHQPEYIGSATSVRIPDATISRAYYGFLAGQPAVFTVTLQEQSSLYLNILSPYAPDAKKDFVVHITDATGATVATLAGSDWQQWYESFAGDTYWKGPEFKETLPAGTYTIEVRSPNNSGKYVLAPGEAEVFTLAGTPRTIREIYTVKTLFFGKPWYSIFEGIIGHVLLGGAVVLIVGIIWGAFLFRRKRSGLRK